MAYTYKSRLETVAEAITELRWSEMQDLSSYIASVDVDHETERDASFWACILNDWANDRMSEYAAK